MMNASSRADFLSAVLVGFLTLGLPTATLSKDVAPLTQSCFFLILASTARHKASGTINRMKRTP